ncbi:MAG: sulfurtransferase [Bacillus sp. (in: firmicutes)]
MFVIIALAIVLIFLLSRRYLPVKNVPYEGKVEEVQEVIVDIRDYNIADKNPLQGSINIPVAYIERYHEEIPKDKVHLIVHDELEKNIGVRMLRKKGIHVISYSVM